MRSVLDQLRKFQTKKKYWAEQVAPFGLDGGHSTFPEFRSAVLCDALRKGEADGSKGYHRLFRVRTTLITGHVRWASF